MIALAGIPTTDGLDRRVDSGPIALSGADWTLVGLIQVSSRDRMLVDIEVAGGALTGLRVTRSATVGGHDAGDYAVLAEDADFNTATSEIPNAIPADPQLAPEGSHVQIMLNCDGAREYAVWAKGAGARLRASLPRSA